MVNLSLDPPPFSFGRRSSGGGGVARLLGVVLVLVVGLAGGFFAGRRTTVGALLLPPAAQLAAVHAAPGDVAGPGRAPAVAAVPAGAARPPPAALAAAPQPVVPGPTAAPAAPARPQGGAPQAAAVPPGAGPTAPPAVAAGPLVRRLAVTLEGPLEGAITAALPADEKGWAEELTQVVNRILVWTLQVSRDGRRGDRMELLYELPPGRPAGIAPVGDGGPVMKEPVVLALRYGSQKLGRLVTAYRFKTEGSAFPRYYTRDGVEVEEHLVDSPVDDYEQVTSLLRDGRRHKGVDFKTPVGTLVKAPFDGQVVRRNWHFAANGNCLEIVDSRSGRHAIFLHLEEAPKEMQPGRKIHKGEVIARSGNSGHSTAPHLHYQLEAPDGRVLDPFAVLPKKQVSLAGVAKAAFEVERSRLDPMLVAGR